MRMDRCRKILGVSVSDDQMLDALARLGFDPVPAGDRLDCTVPIHRLDIEREIDLIEEVGRMFGHDIIPIHETIEIRVAPPQPAIEAARAVHDTLVGMGYMETITNSLIDEKSARQFMTTDMSELRVDDDRAKAWPVLRPSVLPSLLKVRALNMANGVNSLKLFESASTFWRTDDGHQEVVRLGLLADIESRQEMLRPIRGAIQRILTLLLGPDVDIDVRAVDTIGWLAPGATITVNGDRIGCLGVIPHDVTKQFGLDDALLAAEIDVQGLYEQYPPLTESHALPAYPAIERDVSAILDETVPWAQVQDVITDLKLQYIDSLDFVTVFRGKPIERGRKSLTFRLCFRAPDRTLTHDEIDPQMTRLIGIVQEAFNAEIRT